MTQVKSNTRLRTNRQFGRIPEKIHVFGYDNHTTLVINGETCREYFRSTWRIYHALQMRKYKRTLALAYQYCGSPRLTLVEHRHLAALLSPTNIEGSQKMINEYVDTMCADANLNKDSVLDRALCTKILETTAGNMIDLEPGWYHASLKAFRPNGFEVVTKIEGKEVGEAKQLY